MGLAEKKVAPGLAKARSTPAKHLVVMVALAAKARTLCFEGKELASDFASAVTTARTDRGWDNGNWQKNGRKNKHCQ